MMKKIIKKVAALLIFALLFACSFDSLSKVLSARSQASMQGLELRIQYAHRGEELNTVDVFFVGNSDMYSGFSPLHFYNDHHITSTVSGLAQADMKAMYSAVEDAFKYQNPKVVVVETDSFFSTKTNNIEKNSISEVMTYKSASVIPNKVSIAKVAQKASTIADAGDDEVPVQDVEPVEDEYQKNDLKSKIIRKMNRIITFLTKDGDDALLTELNYYAPVVRYHNNWKNRSLSEWLTADQRYYGLPSKGLVFSNHVIPLKEEYNNYMERRYTEGLKLSDSDLKTFDELYELCKANNAELVLMTIPSASSWSNQKSEIVQELADKYNLKFYDYNKQPPAGFDWSLHSKDGGNHLNYDGAIILTADFGENLIEDCGLTPTRLTEEQETRWSDDFDLFREKFHITY